MWFSKGRVFRPALIAAFAVIPALLPLDAIAGNSPAWTRLGPEGGTIFSIEATAQSPQRLIARGGRHLYKSFDNGETWQAIPESAGLGVLVGHQTVALPSNEIDTIYALSADGRLLRSDDFGVSWSELLAPNGALPPDAPRYVLDLVSVDPNDNDRITVHGRATAVSQVFPFYSLEWNSADRGATWQSSNFVACRGGHHRVVAVDTSNTVPPKRILWTSGSTDCAFPVAGHGLWVYSEGGVGSYFPFYPGRQPDIQLQGDHLFVLTSEGVRRVHLQTDETQTISGPASAFAARSATEIYVATRSAVLRTQDAGATWNTLPFSATGFGTLAHPQVLRALSSENVVLAAARGVVTSPDSGNSWSASNGITEMRMRALDIDPLSGRLWALHTDPVPNNFASGPGSFSSIDGGQTWLQSNLHSIAHLLRDIEVDLTTSSRPGGARVYAAGAGCRDIFGCDPFSSGMPANGGLYISDDGGTTFAASNVGLPLSFGTPFVHIVRDITLDPNSGSAGLLRRGLFSASRNGWMPGRTSDAGESWQVSAGGFDQSTDVTYPYPSQSVFDRNRPGRAYTVAFHLLFEERGNAPSGVLRSDDAGATWAQAATGLPTESNMPTIAHSAYGVTMDGSTADRLWVTTRSEEGVSGIHRSDDGAESWYPCGRIAGARFLDKIAQDPERPSRIVVSDRGSESSPGVTRDGAVWISDNRCLTWQRLGPSLDAGAFGLEIANGKVYAGTDSGVQVFDMPSELDGVIFLSSFE